MDTLPERDDLIYKEIEEFQDYELTNCVAYEMAIRNENINELIKQIRIPNYYNELLNEEEQEIENESKLILSDYGFDIFETFDCPNAGKISTSYIYYSKKLNSPQTVYTTECNRLNILKEVIEEGSHILHLEGISLNFSRPKLHLNYKNSFELSINLNLSKEELIAYITKIKDDFDKDNSIIKTPLELLGETFEKSDNKKNPKKPKASVYADWFYIYDYWKYEKTQGKTDKDIFVALEVENNVPYKEDMLRKIRDKMKYFIDDLGYKELIAGVRNS